MLAIIGSAPYLASLLLLSFFFAAMGLMSDSDMRMHGALIPLFGTGLSSLAMFVFLVSLYGEASGRTSVNGRRKAAMVAAALRVLGTISYLVTFRALSPGMRAFSLIGSAAWITFYVVFARDADPLGKRVSSSLAAFLAALTAVSAVIGSYSFRRQFTYVVPPLLSFYYLPILMTMLELVSLLVFLVAVWRYRPAPPAPVDQAQGTI